MPRKGVRSVVVLFCTIALLYLWTITSPSERSPINAPRSPSSSHIESIFGHLWNFVTLKSIFYFWILLVVIIIFIAIYFVCLSPYSAMYLSASPRFEISMDEYLRGFISAVLIFSRVDISITEMLREVIVNRLGSLRVFTHRIVKPWYSWAYFEKVYEDREMVLEECLKQHVEEIWLEFEGEEACYDLCGDAKSSRLHLRLEETFTELASVPMDISRPLFRFYIVHFGSRPSGDDHEVLLEEGNTNGGCAVVMHLHHAICDGHSSVQLLFHVTDRGLEVVGGEKTAEDQELARLKQNSTFVPPPKPGFVASIRNFVAATWKTLTFPIDSKEMCLSFRDGLTSSDCVRPQSFCCLPVNEVSVRSVKRLAYETGVTVNDVLTSVVSGGFRKYLRRHGTPLDMEMVGSDEKDGELSHLNTFTWVSTRKESFPKLIARCARAPANPEMTDADFGVDIGCLFHPTPVHIASHRDRMMASNATLKSLFYSPEPIVNRLIMRGLGLLPPPLCVPVVNAVGHKTTLSISNVPGPQYPLLFCGKEVDAVSFFVTPLGTISNMVLLFSYNDAISISIQGVFDLQVHREIVNDIVDCFREHIALIEGERSG